MSKQFKCPKCGESSSQCIRLDDGTYLHECGSCSGFRWSESTFTNTKYLAEVPDEPPRPVEDELMQVAPGLEVDRFAVIAYGDTVANRLPNGELEVFRASSVSDIGGLGWILKKRPDLAYYQRENAEKWLAKNRPDLKIVGLKRLVGTKSELCIYRRKSEFETVNDGRGLKGEWRWVVEPKERVKEYKLNFGNFFNPWYEDEEGNAIEVKTLIYDEFCGFVFQGGSIEADFKRMRNGQVEWATKVRVKE